MQKSPMGFPMRHSLLFPKQIRMSTRTSQCQHKDILINAIDQQPIGLNVTFPVSAPFSREGMISIFYGKPITHGKDCDHTLKQFDIQPSLQGELLIFLKLSRIFEGQFCFSHFFKSSNSSSRSE